MGIVYHPARMVNRRAGDAEGHGLDSGQKSKFVVVGPVGSVGNSRSEFSKRRWGTWAGPPPGRCRSRMAVFGGAVHVLHGRGTVHSAESVPSLHLEPMAERVAV